jgi:imidazolonepropionase-like amidohydrolase
MMAAERGCRRTTARADALCAPLSLRVRLLVEAGVSPREALAAATRTAAAFLRQARMVGTLEVGKTADLSVLGADPVASIAAIRQIEVVIRDGRAWCGGDSRAAG